MKHLLVITVLALCVIGVYAQQSTIILNDPVQAQTGASAFQLVLFSYDMERKEIIIIFREVGGSRQILFTYFGDAFDISLSNFINIALERKIIQQLQTDGKLGAGTITAAP